MSLFKAAVQGFAASTANVANKYLDEQIAKDRAEFMAQLQRRTAGEIRADDLAFKTDPGNLQRVTEAERTTVLARGAAQRDAEKAGMSDTEYQGMKDAQAEKDTQREVRKTSLIEQARSKYAPRGGGGGGNDDPFAKLPPAVRASYQGLAKQAENINAAITRAQADGTWEPDKNKSQSDLLVRMRVIEDKAQELLQPYIPKPQGGPAAGGDDEIRKALLGDSASQAPGAAPAAGKGAPAKPSGPMANTDDRTLQRLAAIDGHANQAAAIEELKRRGKWKQPGQPSADSGVDYSAIGLN